MKQMRNIRSEIFSPGKKLSDFKSNIYDIIC